MKAFDICFLSTSVLDFDPARADPSFGSDVVVLDLEDSIHVSAKAAARAALTKLDLRLLVERGYRFGVRVNALSSIEGVRDLDAVYEACESERLAIDYLQVPKIASASDLAPYESILAGMSRAIGLFPIVETPEAVADVDAIAARSDALLLGMEDLVATMYTPNEAYLGYARGRFCVACARQGISAIDTKGGMQIENMALYEQACLDGKAEGFTGRSTIHQKQIPVVRKVFSPNAQELAKCRNIIDSYATSPQGFTILDGQVIAPPFVARAEMTLQRYGIASRAHPRRRRALA